MKIISINKVIREIEEYRQFVTILYPYEKICAIKECNELINKIIKIIKDNIKEADKDFLDRIGKKIIKYPEYHFTPEEIQRIKNALNPFISPLT